MADKEHSEDEKALPENKKRTVKTRAQVEALEQFYDEHKYPTESMKEELAKSIGLTEKQVSGWFCHRRLKDKKLQNPEAYASGKQDRTSGIVQDRGSGFRQDSCGSTKQGDDRHFEPREVESRRLTCQESSAADINYELGGRHVAMAKHRSPDDTSSGSSSSLQHTSFSHERDHFGVDVSRNYGHALPIGVKGFKPRAGPSGYLKVKGQVENSAITAVKRQLGRHYRADGPPLGVEFDPLPPGAFESPIAEPPNGSYYAEAALAYSPEVVIGHRNHNSGSGYRYISGVSSHNSQMDSRSKKACVSDHPEGYYQEKLHTKSPKYNQNDFHPAKGSLTDIHEGSVKRTRVYESWDTDQRALHDMGMMNLDSVSGLNQSNLYAAKINRKPSEPWLQNHKSKRPKVSTSDHYDSGRLNSTSQVFESDDLKYKGLSRRTPKEETISAGEKVANIDSFDPVQPEASKRIKNELVEDYINQPFRKEASPWENQVPRPADVPSSYSEDDETADASSED